MNDKQGDYFVTAKKMIDQYLLALLIVGLLVLSVKAQSATSEPTPLAPGYGKLAYPLPAVGSYQLPALGVAADGNVLDDTGKQHSLRQLLNNKKYTLLSFVYSNCSDVNGCPLVSNVFYKVKSAMRSDEILAERLQLLTISFDPERDTPEVMRLYSENFKYAGNKGEWRFLTTKSLNELNPILDAYHQDIQRNLSVNGSENGDISHLLRAYLIAPDLSIRNIYSVGFLHSDLLINDVKTLLQNDPSKTLLANKVKPHALSSLLSKAGDDKAGYQNNNYKTNSKALTARSSKGKEADLLAIANNPPLGLPKLSDAVLSTLTKEKIALGRSLFFDRRLSLNNTFSCAMCHVPEQGFTNYEVSMAVGIEGRSVRRNSPTIYNVAYARRLFHDGRETSLEQQVWGPLLAKNEMGNPSVGAVIDKIKSIPDYKKAFFQVFGKPAINMLTLGEALASYQRTLISADSAFDRWYFNKQTNALSQPAQRGFKIFTGKGKCSSCHLINQKFALFTDNEMHNTGLGYNNSMGIRPKMKRINIAPGVFIEADMDAIEKVSEPPIGDLGLYEITENPADRWKYKTPSLRNISLTAPYMHNGSLGSLKEVVEFYSQGGITNEVLDPLIQPLNLKPQEKDDLVSFLQSLTGSNVDSLVADAFAVPVGDIESKVVEGKHE
jgi:cytochrome c peroxidase